MCLKPKMTNLKSHVWRGEKFMGRSEREIRRCMRETLRIRVEFGNSGGVEKETQAYYNMRREMRMRGK